MSKKTIIVIILIVSSAFFLGWFIYKCLNPNNLPGQEASEPVTLQKENTSISVGPGYNRMVNILGLSNEQTSKFLQIEGQYRQTMARYINQLDSIDLAIIREIQKDIPDKIQLDSLAMQSGQIQYALKKATFQHFMQIKNICNPEQQKLFMKVIAEIGQYRRGQGRGQGNGQGKGRGWRNRNR